MNSPRFHITRADYGLGLNINFGGFDRTAIPGQERLVAAEPVTTKVFEPNTYPQQPMLHISHHDENDVMQKLMDDLWQLGFRPSDIGTPGHLAATTKHLEDMRALVFAKLEAMKP